MFSRYFSLFFYAFGLCGYSGVKIATDGFYALKDIRTPVIVSLFTIAFNILLNYALIFQLGFDHRSLAISTACSVTVNFLIVLGLLWRRVGNLGGRDLALVFVRSVIAAAGMGTVAALTHGYLLYLIDSKLSLLAAIIVAVPAFYLLCRVLKLREVDQVVGAFLEKIRR